MQIISQTVEQNPFQIHFQNMCLEGMVTQYSSHVRAFLAVLELWNIFEIAFVDAGNVVVVGFQASHGSYSDSYVKDEDENMVIFKVIPSEKAFEF